VRVFVAIHAALANLPELPFVFGWRRTRKIALLQVTGETRRRQVCTVKFILRFRVILDGKNAADEPIGIMTNITIRADIVNGKLLFVIIFMAISAILERQRVGHFFRSMALFAVHRNVFAFECKSRFIVVEFVQIPRFSPAAFVVAIHAFSAEFAFMRVLVAGLTIIGGNAQSVLKNIDRRDNIHFMALPAIHVMVFAF